MDERGNLPRPLAVNEDHGWQVRWVGDQDVELDLGPICLWITDDELVALARLAALAIDAGDAEGVLASAGPRRIAHRCPHTGVFSLLFDRTILRFCPHELAAFAELCRVARAALDDSATPMEIWFSRN